MLQVKITAVGKIREKYLQDGIKEYLKRLGGYLKIQIEELGDEPCPEKSLQAEEEKIKRKEGDKILKTLTAQDYVVLLDLDGSQLDSAGLAEFLEDKALQGQSRICFVIGGSLGVSDEVRARADFRWSFSKLTFPHQLMRMLLLEQLYRACRISRGEPYHK
ncbi:Ribosomal RNA large subunit methyltransferase H [Syntrophobotulus glycolicus DSM 8271]|uniref:Ribosomal RNA large subunit methyltransferase H n=1 Tax=Syntrophobotulus glycolicus (strain DSM 8271 / FlGlyR) TaxID=645991 RepID=F0T2U2_SYNGF|nr:23S rRNA (pseudouridine(1915)-N(3))-methyltransferase RlmH [Syntrophobotulus glycolicus]ADY57579.1 Ribosomal RNA large subunit methyltransferase H [Syntrophobotulus glycolicus DSM 8271]